MKAFTNRKYAWWKWSLVFVLFLPCHVYGQTFQQQIDSMLEVYAGSSDLETRVHLLNEVAYAYRRISPDSTLFYAEQALQHAIALGDAGAIAYAYKNKGIGHFKMGADPDTIVAYYSQAIKYAERAEDHYTQAACYNNIGLISLSDLAYNEAVQYFLQGVKLFDDHISEENFLKALMLGNIGTAYHKDGDNRRGIPYYEQSLAMAERIGNKTIPSIFVDELARARMEEGDLDGAERDIIALMPLHDELGDFESKSETLLTWSEVKMAKSDFKTARDHALAAFQIANSRDFIRNKAVALTRLAQAYRGMDQLDSAVFFAEQAVMVGKVGELYTLNKDAFGLLADTYAEMGNYDRAYYYAEELVSLHRRNSNETKQRIADDLEAKYQNEQRLAEIERLNEERRAQQQGIYGLIALVLLTLTVLSGMFYQYRQKEKATSALHIKNAELQEAEERLSDKNVELERYIESNLQLENFAHLASHDLREPLRNIVSFSQLLQKRSQEKLTDQEQEFLQFIVQGTERIDGLVKDLLAYSTVSNDPLTLTKVDTVEVLSDVREDLRQMIAETGADIQCANLPVLALADRSRLHQLFQNLISNAIRYHRPGTPPQIVIDAQTTTDQVVFRIADNGIGIDPKYHQQIFLLFKSLENKSIHNSSGIGLATSKRVVEDHGGRIWVEPNEPFGSVFCFTIARNLQ